MPDPLITELRELLLDASAWGSLPFALDADGVPVDADGDALADNEGVFLPCHPALIVALLNNAERLLARLETAEALVASTREWDRCNADPYPLGSELQAAENAYDEAAAAYDAARTGQ